MLKFLTNLNMFEKIYSYDYNIMKYCDYDENANIIIARNIMSRGYDFKNIKNVVNYDFPNKSKTHIHRYFLFYK